MHKAAYKAGVSALMLVLVALSVSWAKSHRTIVWNGRDWQLANDNLLAQLLTPSHALILMCGALIGFALRGILVKAETPAVAQSKVSVQQAPHAEVLRQIKLDSERKVQLAIENQAKAAKHVQMLQGRLKGARAKAKRLERKKADLTRLNESKP